MISKPNLTIPVLMLTNQLKLTKRWLLFCWMPQLSYPLNEWESSIEYQWFMDSIHT